MSPKNPCANDFLSRMVILRGGRTFKKQALYGGFQSLPLKEAVGGGPLVSSSLSFFLPDHEIRSLLCCVLSVMHELFDHGTKRSCSNQSWTEASKIVSKSNPFLYRLVMRVFGIIAEDIILSNLKKKDTSNYNIITTTY